MASLGGRREAGSSEDVMVHVGQRITSKSAYSARGFLLAHGETFPADPSTFDRGAHAPRLLQVEKGRAFEVLGELPNGQVFVRAEQNGSVFACLLLPDSYEA
jgi:hypothetical protein